MKAFLEWSGARFWSTLSTAQQASLFITAASSVIACAVFYLYGPNAGFYYSLIGMMTLALLYDRLTRYHFENDTVTALRQNQLSARDLHHIGNSADGIQWLCQHMHGARTVMNTVYRPSGIETVGDMSSDYATYLRGIRSALDNKCIWYDLAMPGHEGAMAEFAATLSAEQRRNYRPHVFRSGSVPAVPLFQVTVLSYGSRKAVSFGWAFPRSRGDSKVYVSTDTETAEYFDTYFRGLIEHAQSFETEPARTMSRDVETNDGTVPRPS